MGNQCISFPDIYQDPGDPTNPAYDEITRANEAHGKVYRAAAYVITKDFRPDLKDAIPRKPEEFPGNAGYLTDDDIAMVASVHGMLIADNWDPTMGKSKPFPGDQQTSQEWGGIVLDRRFIDATVVAVKAYTAQSDLFNNCFQLLKIETETTPPGPQPADRSRSVSTRKSRGAQPTQPADPPPYGAQPTQPTDPQSEADL